VYGTLIRNAGWTFAQCWDQPACDVFELLEHLQEYPPDYLILAAVHLKPKPQKKKPLTDAEREAQREEMRSVFGRSAPVPQDLRDLVAWAAEQDKKMGIAEL
jgi:hypothetical protein